MEPEGSLPHSQVPATCPYTEPALCSPHSTHPTFCRSILILSSHLPLGLRSYHSISPVPRQVFIFRNEASFYGEELLAPRPTPKREDYPLSAVCDLFNILAATLHIAGRSSIRNLKTRRAVVTGTHLSRFCLIQSSKYRIIQKDCWGFNNLSYTIHLR